MMTSGGEPQKVLAPERDIFASMRAKRAHRNSAPTATLTERRWWVAAAAAAAAAAAHRNWQIQTAQSTTTNTRSHIGCPPRTATRVIAIILMRSDLETPTRAHASAPGGPRHNAAHACCAMHLPVLDMVGRGRRLCWLVVGWLRMVYGGLKHQRRIHRKEEEEGT